MTNMLSAARTIMLVEDDASIRETIQELLELEGYKVVTAINGKKALEKLMEMVKPCLVLLDMMMPVMNGREFLDHKMKDKDLSFIPVIIISAIADQTNTQGAAGFIRKPADLDAILEAVESHCH